MCNYDVFFKYSWNNDLNIFTIQKLSYVHLLLKQSKFLNFLRAMMLKILNIWMSKYKMAGDNKKSF